MKLRLYERRTNTKLVDGSTAHEDDCMFCGANNTVYQLEPLKPNTQGQKDGRGNIMMEHRVSCTRCNKEWIDVFCRLYPSSVGSQDENMG